MPTFDLDADFMINFNCYRDGGGFVAKGVVHFRGKPRRVFEVHALTISAAEEAAKAKATEICSELKTSRRIEAKKRLPKKR